MNEKLDTLVKDLQEAFESQEDCSRDINRMMVLSHFDFIATEDDYIYIQKRIKKIKAQIKHIEKMYIRYIWWYKLSYGYRIRGSMYIQRKFPYCIIDKIKEGLRKWK